jgi:hypothetical protein
VPKNFSALAAVSREKREISAGWMKVMVDGFNGLRWDNFSYFLLISQTRERKVQTQKQSSQKYLPQKKRVERRLTK